MKNSSKILFALLTITLGVGIGIQVRGPYQMSGYGSTFNRELISKINKERIEIYDLEKQKRNLKKNVDVINRTASYNNEDIATYKNRLDNLEKTMGYVNVKGPGIVMTVDGYEDYNIAYLMEEKNLLILLVNELKSVRAEAISINGQRISPISEIVLAGNHININYKAIAQPYEIRVIGESGKILEYMDSRSPVVDIMRRGYGLNISFRYEEELIIRGLDKQKPIENISRNEV